MMCDFYSDSAVTWVSVVVGMVGVALHFDPASWPELAHKRLSMEQVSTLLSSRMWFAGDRTLM